jgi:hypothetical protein
MPVAWTLAMFGFVTGITGAAVADELSGACWNLPIGHQPMVGSEQALPVAQNIWKDTKKINVVFHDSTGKWVDAVKQAVKRNLKEWEKYASIEFTFNELAKADVRVQIVQTTKYPLYTYQSWVGPDCRKYAAQMLPSTWLVFPENTSERELRRVILHEFGHVLGLIHELKRPDKKLLWDDDEVVKYYAFTKWSKEKILQQVKSIYQGPIVDRSPFDIQSITVYPVKKGLAWDFDPQTKAKRDFVTEMPFELSPMDRAFASRLYPSKPSGQEESVEPDGMFHAGKIPEDGAVARYRFGIEKDGKFHITLRPKKDTKTMPARVAIFGATEIEQTQARLAAAAEGDGSIDLPLKLTFETMSQPKGTYYIEVRNRDPHRGVGEFELAVAPLP